MTSTSVAVSTQKRNMYPNNFVPPEPEAMPVSDFQVGRQKFGAKMPLSACYTQAQRDGYLSAYNRKGLDAYLRCCESEGMPAEQATQIFEGC